jgi:hypothetical protein
MRARGGLMSAAGSVLALAGLLLLGAGRAEAADAHAKWGLTAGQTAIGLSENGHTASARAGVRLRIDVLQRLRRRPAPTFSADVRITAGPAGRRCAANPRRDRGRTIARDRMLRAASGPYALALANHTFRAGAQRLCAWTRPRGQRRWSRPAVRDVVFYDALFGAALVGSPNAWFQFEALSTHPMRSDWDFQFANRYGPGCNPRTANSSVHDRPEYAGRVGYYEAVSQPSLLQDAGDGCTEDALWTPTVTGGPLAGQAAPLRFTEGMTSFGAPFSAAAHSGACFPTGLLNAGTPAQALALLTSLGCRPGRVLAVRRPGSTQPPTGQVYGAAIAGMDAYLAPAGTAVDLLVDAAPARPPGPPADPEPPPGIGYPGLPPVQDDPRCVPKVTAGPLEGVASCWRQRGDAYVASGRVRLNGVDLTPARAGIQVRLDTRRQWVTSTGPVEVRIGLLPLLRARIDWRGRTHVFTITGKSPPRDPGAPFDATDFTLFGLPVGGSAELRFEGGATKLKASISIPDDPALRVVKRFAGWSGDLTAAATNDRGLVLDGATVEVPGIQAGFVEIQNAKLVVSQVGAAYHFDGGVTVFPFPVARLGFAGQLGFGVGDGYFKVGVAAEQLNRLLVGGVFLQRLGAAVQVNPFGLSGSAAVTFGPQLRLGGDLVSAARMDGTLSYLVGARGAPGAIELTGALELAEAKVASGKVKVAGSAVDVEGDMRLTIGEYGVTGRLKGWVEGRRAFNVEGGATVVIPGPDQSGEAVLSTRGAGGCRRGFGPDVGFGYRWGAGLGGVDLFAHSCDLGGWRELRGGARASQAGGAGFLVRRGTRTVALSAVGRGGAPQVAFVAPDGTRYAPSAAPNGVVSTEQVLLVQDPSTATTAFAIDAPQRGRWRIEPLAGSVPVAAYRGTTALPPVRVRARVTRARGGRRALRYRIRNLGSARVTFVERGAGLRRVLGSTSRRRGTLRFRPAAGGRRRAIVALVERNGHPTGRSARVARYRAGGLRPRRPRGIRVRRSARLGRALTWRGPRAHRYLVTVRTADGRRLRYLRGGARRRVVVPHVPRRQRIRIAIRAIDASGAMSAAARRSSRR